MQHRWVTRKLISLLGFVALLLVPVFTFANGQSESSSSSKPKQITFYMAVYDGLTQSYWTSLESAFNKANPGIHVKIVGIPWDQLQNKLTTALAGGKPPQASIIGTRWLLDFVKNDQVVPVTKYVSKSTIDNIIPGDLEAKINGTLWAIPDAAGARLMAINTSITTKVPKTMEQLEQDAIAANDPPNHYGLIMVGKKNAELSPFVYYFYAAGGHFFSHKADGSLDKSTVNSPAGIKALTFMNKLANKDKVVQQGFLGETRVQSDPVFYAGKAAYVMIGAWVDSAMKQAGSKFKVQYAQIPPFAGNKSTPLVVTDSIAMFKDAPNLPAMGKFIDFFYQKSWKSKFDEAIGFPPVTKDAATLPAFQSPLYKALGVAANNARGWPLVAGWQQDSDIMWNAVSQVLTGNSTPKAALDSAAAQIDKAMGL